MARATLATVKRIVYDNLGLTDQTAGYGNLASNERYLTGYVDDAISQADIVTSTLLLKNKQETLMSELYTDEVGVSPVDVDDKWFIISADYYVTGGTGRKRGTEITYDEWVRLDENAGGLYTDPSLKYGYYCIQDGKVYMFPDQMVGFDNTVVVHVDLNHQTTLTSLRAPSGFESCVANLASAILLMKRADKPEQANFYMGLYREFMQQYLLPDNNIPNLIDD